MQKKMMSMLVVAALFSMNASAQLFLTRNGKATFFSKAPIENIEAVNNEITSVLDTKKGEFQFGVLIKSFKFKKALMEEHFNENYLESNTYPKANFKGAIADISKVDFTKDGNYDVTVAGDLLIHGITKKISVPGNIAIAGGKISATAKFKVNVKDYNIKIPTTLVNNIAETVDVTVDCKYDPYKKG